MPELGKHCGAAFTDFQGRQKVLQRELHNWRRTLKIVRGEPMVYKVCEQSEPNCLFRLVCIGTKLSRITNKLDAFIAEKGLTYSRFAAEEYCAARACVRTLPFV